jgi:FdhD protein
MNKKYKNKEIQLSDNGLSPTSNVITYNHLGEEIVSKVAGELPLTIKINNTEIITLMTLGTRPEELTLGYLRNQGIIDNINDIISVDVRWDIGISDVQTKHKDIKEITIS